VLALLATLQMALVQTFAPPSFGIRNQRCPSTFVGECAVLRSSQASTSPRRVVSWARGGKKDDDEDEWEPTEEDLLKDLEDLNIDDVVADDDVDIEDDTMVMINDDDKNDVIEEDNEDDDDDDDDDDLDIWEEDDDEDDEGIDEETDGEWEEEYEYEEEEQPTAYLGAEADQEDEEWDEDEGNTDVPLMDDPDDPNYMAQKKLVEETIARRETLRENKEFDEFDFLFNRMPKELADQLDKTEFVQETSKFEDKVLQLTDQIQNLDLEEEMAKTSDLMEDDPYENEGRTNILDSGLSDDDMENIDKAYKRIQKTLAKEPWNKVEYKVEITDFHSLPNQTIQEMDACLDEIAGSSYNCTRWLLYDLDFNVSNLILAAVKHNPQAPIIFQHWFPQLVTYERYQHARDINFDFSWDDVENADVDELERYYMGFGYLEIPSKAPAETGIIGFEDLDDEELKMAAFENWMIEVYNPEWDRKDFDDDSFQDEDNVFSKFFEEPQHPDLPTYEDMQEDFQNWEEELEEEGEENQEYKDFVAKEHKYDVVEDEEFQREFRGHLIVACTPTDADLEIAEKITKRMDEEFRKQVYVETRVIAHAKEEDNVFEIWLESYEVDLLHSKKRATSGAEDWNGPAECDDDQIEYLVDQVRFFISDEARFSYRFQLDKELAM